MSKLIDVDAFVQAMKKHKWLGFSCTVIAAELAALPDESERLASENESLRSLVGELVEGLAGVHDALNKAHESHMAEVQGHDRTVDRLEGEIKRYRDSVKALIAKAKEQVK